jgi:hypothetical protein
VTGKQLIAIAIVAGAVLGVLLAPAVMVMMGQIGDGDAGF